MVSLVAQTSDVSPHLHTLLQKRMLSLRSEGGTQEEEVHATKGRSIATGHGCPTSSPGAWWRGSGFGNSIPIPTGICTDSLVRDIRVLGNIYTQCPPCASGIVSRAVVSTYYSSCLLSYECEAAVSKCAEDIFASSPLQPPPDRNRGICKSWHISSP